jgi:hypothetical protein
VAEGATVESVDAVSDVGKLVDAVSDVGKSVMVDAVKVGTVDSVMVGTVKVGTVESVDIGATPIDFEMGASCRLPRLLVEYTLSVISYMTVRHKENSAQEWRQGRVGWYRRNTGRKGKVSG